jgi:hypothetical protein
MNTMKKNKMNHKKILLLLFLILISFLQFACSCGCGKNSSEEKYIKGYITVVGNEPFIHLAVKTDEGENIILQCSKELENDLMKKQGTYYYIIYGSIKKENNVSTVIVEKVIPFIKENKTN